MYISGKPYLEWRIIMNSIENNNNMSKLIKNRREELGLTIEQAAKKANVGTRTWSRYESGSPIRQDKIKGILVALRWSKFPNDEKTDVENYLDEYRNHDAWSETINDLYGKYAAIAFCIGSDILSDYIMMDLEELSSLPKGSHIGQLNASNLQLSLPEEFLMEYDYNFLIKLKRALNQLIIKAVKGDDFIAHKPIEEIILKSIIDEAELLMQEMLINLNKDDFEDFQYWDEWIYDMFGDNDIEIFLYSDMSLPIADDYKFDSWFEDRFYVNDDE